jgi:tetratricopeptide (TPR) repeat protein
LITGLRMGEAALGMPVTIGAPGRVAFAGLLSLAVAAAAQQEGARAPLVPESVRAFHRGDYEGAITLATRELAARPTDVTARISLARAQAALGRFDAAYQGFLEARRQDPRNVDALYYVGITAGVLAEGEYQRLLALDPGSARAHQLLAESLEAQGRRPEAEVEWKAALEANPKSVEALVALGDLARAQLRFAEALEHYAKAASLAPANYDVVYGTGVCHLFRGERSKALEAFREALRLDPDSASARLALGTVLLQGGQAEAAAVELEAAIALRPRMRQAHYQLGRAYQALGRSAEADAAFARVKALVGEELEAEDELLVPGPP